MSNLIHEYLGHLRHLMDIRKKRYSQNTLAQYEGVLGRFDTYLSEIHSLHLDNHDIAQIDSGAVEGYYKFLNEKHSSTATLNNYVTILKGFFEYLITAGIIESNPSEGIYRIVEGYADAPPSPEDQKFYTDDQLKALYDFLSARRTKSNLRDLAMISVMLSTGLRISEVCSLNISNYDDIADGGGTSVLRKGGRWSRIEFGGFVVEDIAAYLKTRGQCDEDEPLFITSHGNRVDRRRAWDRFRIIQESIGMATGTHTFRHTAITSVAYDKGIDEASRFAGHAAKKTTGRYLHINRDVAKETAETLAGVRKGGMT